MGDSDVSGCLCLMQPAILQTTLALNSPKIPVLSLLDALHQQGFAGRDQGVLHQHANFKNYDERNIVAKRAYLQCVLAMQSILPKAGSFPSGEPQSFYMLLLRGRTVAPGQGAKEYKKQLAQLTGDVLDWPPWKPRRQHRRGLRSRAPWLVQRFGAMHLVQVPSLAMRSRRPTQAMRPTR